MRRPLSVVLLGVLILSMAVFGVSAQEGTPAAEEHPLVGTWVLDTDTEDPANPPSLAVFSADDTYIEIDVDGSAAGVWEATGEHTANLTFHFVDGEGMGTIRAGIEVAPDGQTLTASYTFEFIAPDGTISGQLGPGSASGTRVTVEPQGTPVASFEEAFASPPATPAS